LREDFGRFNFGFHKEKEMADFRRWILALALLVLVFGWAAPASAQPFSCATTVVPPQMRAEGVTELVGDIVLTCTGTPSSTGTVNITVNLPNVPVTSRLETTTVSGGGFETDALLVVNEAGAPGQAAQAIGTNVFQGAWFASQPDSMVFDGIPVVAPGSSGSTIYRITNIRANVSVMGVGPTAFVNLLGYVSASPSTSLPITNAQPIVGFVSWGMAFPPSPAGSTGVYSFADLPSVPGTLSTINFLQCQTQPFAGLDVIRFQEGFASAFKVQASGPQNVPGLPNVFASESGLIVPSSNTPPLGQADYGTRLKAVFTGLPAGVTIYVGNSNVCYTSCITGTTKAVLLGASDTTVNATVDSPPLASPTTMTDLAGYGYPVVAYSIGSSGTLEVVWEVIGEDPTQVEDFDFPIFISYAAAPGSPGSPTPISTPASVVLNFAPTIDELSSTSPNPYSLATTGPIPRFAPVHTASYSLLTLGICRTHLLFPYVTDYPGFDTGIAISNTSADSLGTVEEATPQTGACTVTFFGGIESAGVFTNTATNIGTAGTADGVSVGVYSSVSANPFGGTGTSTGFIGPGQTWAFSVSGIDTAFGTSTFAGFVGYAIADCNFQYAHGYAFISDYGLRNFAASYLPLVIPDAPRTATPNLCASLPTLGCLPLGEQLVH
jgi:hypothetical protein